MSRRDYYLILDVAPIAAPAEIQKAYRALSKKYHPDLNPEMKQASNEKMKELVEAFNNLNDTNKRKLYDKQPQFQLRKFAKGRKQPDKKAFSSKAEPEKKSIIARLFAPFFKKGAAGPAGPDPKQADVHFTLGLSMADNESFLEQAKAEFGSSVKFDATYKEAAYNYALLCYKLGQFDEARASLQKYVATSADDQLAKKFLSILSD